MKNRKTKKAVKPIVKFKHSGLDYKYCLNSGLIYSREKTISRVDADFRLLRDLEIAIKNHYK